MRLKSLIDDLVIYQNANYDAFIQQKLKINGHPNAIIRAFEGVLKVMEDEQTLKEMQAASGKKFNAWGYMEKIFQVQNGNENMKDSELLHQEIKKLNIKNYDIRKICDRIGNI